MLTIDVVRTETVRVKYLQVVAEVRYWEDGKVDGVVDEDGSLIPLREGDAWCPLIDLEAGMIVGWPTGTEACLHYKVCDAGSYSLLDSNRNTVVARSGYVPALMAPNGGGYGDYIVMEIGSAGTISDWPDGPALEVLLREFMANAAS